MALGVTILAFDRVAPLLRHLEETRLERIVPLVYLSDTVLGLELRIQRVRFVQTLQHVAMLLLRPMHLGELLRNISPQQKVPALQRMVLCTQKAACRVG